MEWRLESGPTKVGSAHTELYQLYREIRQLGLLKSWLRMSGLVRFINTLAYFCSASQGRKQVRKKNERRRKEGGLRRGGSGEVGSGFQSKATLSSQEKVEEERRGVVCKISGCVAPGAKLNVSTKYPFTVTRYGARCTASMSFKVFSGKIFALSIPRCATKI